LSGSFCRFTIVDIGQTGNDGLPMMIFPNIEQTLFSNSTLTRRVIHEALNAPGEFIGCISNE
jgi:hypothetical protein